MATLGVLFGFETMGMGDEGADFPFPSRESKSGSASSNNTETKSEKSSVTSEQKQVEHTLQLCKNHCILSLDGGELNLLACCLIVVTIVTCSKFVRMYTECL